MSTDADAPSPTVLAGRYRLERRVAQGGMAEVWLATDTALSRQVAVKLLKPQLAADPVVAERFRREAIAVASVTHPNIVAVYDAVEDNGRQAVVMQYVQGKTLRQLLDEQGKLSPELTVHIGSALASALDAAHSAGLVHRDVKPGNVLVTPDGRVQLADFGIAKALGSGDDLTSDNVMMGTAKYLSPEQVRGRKLDGRADLYSLGLVLYECLAGRVPFLGETDADTALARLQRDATDLTRLRPTLPRNLATVVHRLMEREPEHRYATGAAVRAALGGALDSPPAEPWTPIARRPGPVTVFDDDLASVPGTPSAGTPAARSTSSTPVTPVLFDAAIHDPTSEAARSHRIRPRGRRRRHPRRATRPDAVRHARPHPDGTAARASRCPARYAAALDAVPGGDGGAVVGGPDRRLGRVVVDRPGITRRRFLGNRRRHHRHGHPTRRHGVEPGVGSVRHRPDR
jgi:serine/threonine protein kinase